MGVIEDRWLTWQESVRRNGRASGNSDEDLAIALRFARVSFYAGVSAMDEIMSQATVDSVAASVDSVQDDLERFSKEIGA